MRALAPLPLLFLAACLGSPPGNGTPTPHDLVSGGQPTPLADLEPILTWSTDRLSGEAGFLATLHADEPVHCLFQGGYAQLAGRTGVTGVFALQGDALNAWSVTDSAQASHVHVAGLVDSRQEAGPGGDREARQTTFEAPSWRGDARFLLLARDLEAWPSTILDGASLAASVRCDGPVTVSRIHTTKAFTLVDAQTLAGGIGAHTSPGASLALFDEENGTVQGDAGLFLWGSIGGAGTLTLDHPEGRQQWAIAGPSTNALLGAPGAYDANLVRAGADLDYFFAVLAGLRHADSLDDLTRQP